MMAGQIVGGAAVLAALFYIGTQVRKIARAITWWADHPALHDELATATRDNTAAISDLTKRLADNGRAQRARRGGP